MTAVNHVTTDHYHCTEYSTAQLKIVYYNY